MRVWPIFLCLLCLLATSCKRGHDLTGKWTGPQIEGATTVFTFGEGNSVVMDATHELGSAHATGTYIVKENQLVGAISSITVAAKDPQKQVLLDMFKPQLEKQMKEGVAGTMEWKDDDHFTLKTEKFGVQQFERLKQ